MLPLNSLVICIGIGVVYVADVDWKQGVLVGLCSGYPQADCIAVQKIYLKIVAINKQYFYFGKERKIK
jgi:hypothetical protein